MRRFVLVLAVLLVPYYSVLAADMPKVDERLDRSAEVINEIMGTPDKGVPHDLLDKAVCVGVVPSEKKLAFGIGGDYGRGALVCRRHGDGEWGPPSMLTVGGGSFGFQIGGQSTDVVFIVMNADGARKLIRDKVQLGADASVAAGPVGRDSSAATDVEMHAEILSYSRSRGIFGGLSLNGAVVKQDHDGNRELYGSNIPARDILFTPDLHVPAAAEPLDEALAKYSPQGGQPVSQ
jgi:SH3 domain-containing YSC84-like protein 1